jgi:hypothetical protein
MPMRIPDDDRDRFEDLDEQRRRVYEEFNLLVQTMREGSVRDTERVRTEAHHLHIRHQGIIRDMVSLLL